VAGLIPVCGGRDGACRRAVPDKTFDARPSAGNPADGQKVDNQVLLVCDPAGERISPALTTR
jgi:hypothetical protein